MSLPQWPDDLGTVVDTSFVSLTDDDDEHSSERFLASSSLQKTVPLSQQRQQQDEEDDDDYDVEEKNEEKKAVFWARLLLIGAAALYGTNFSLVKLMGTASALPSVGLSTTLRFGLATVAMSPWLLAPSSSQEETTTTTIADDDDGRPRRRRPSHWNDSARAAVVAGFEVGLWNMVGYMSQAVGLQTTSASTSAFLCSLAVVVVPFLDVVTGKTLRGREWIGAALALAGVGILEGHDLLAAAGSGTALFTAGDLASMVQPLAFGMGFWRLERAMHDNPHEGRRGVAAQILAVFLGSLVYTWVTDPATLAVGQIRGYLSDPMTLGFLIWTGTVSTALSLYMEAQALKTLTAAETTLLLSTEPLWGSLFASFIIQEKFGVDAALGGLLILSACLYSSLGIAGIQKLLSGKSKDEHAS